MEEVRLNRDVDPAAGVIGRMLADLMDVGGDEADLLALAAAGVHARNPRSLLARGPLDDSVSVAARVLDAVLVFRWLTENRVTSAENVAEALAVMTMLAPTYLDEAVVAQLRALAAPPAS